MVVRASAASACAAGSVGLANRVTARVVGIEVEGGHRRALVQRARAREGRSSVCLGRRSRRGSRGVVWPPVGRLYVVRAVLYLTARYRVGNARRLPAMPLSLCSRPGAVQARSRAHSVASRLRGMAFAPATRAGPVKSGVRVGTYPRFAASQKNHIKTTRRNRGVGGCIGSSCLVVS